MSILQDTNYGCCEKFMDIDDNVYEVDNMYCDDNDDVIYIDNNIEEYIDRIQNNYHFDH